MSASSILVLGSINTDLVIRGPRLPLPGETVLGGEFFQARGGKGANQAVAAARAGGVVAFIGAVGDDEFGEAALASFDREGIDRRSVRCVAGVSSGVALILVDQQGENCISVASGANLAVDAAAVDQTPAELFADAGVFLACLESPLPAVRRGLERAKAAGLITILNPAPAIAGVAHAGLLPLVDVLTPNAGEAIAMLCDGAPGGLGGAGNPAGEEELAAIGREYLQLGAGAVVITRGKQGALVVAADGTVSTIPAPAVAAVDTTAAGDAFSGTLAVALSERRPLLEAARWATRAAALSVTRRGAQPSLPSRREIDDFTG